jgi:hypothetical protein
VNTVHKIVNEYCQGINCIGVVLALPILIATAMSFDHPSDPPHWAHWAFVIGMLAFPGLSLAGLLSRRERYLGLIGLALAVIGNLVLSAICHGEFRCAA